MHDPVFHLRHTLTLLAGMNALGPVSQDDLAKAVVDIADCVDRLSLRHPPTSATLPVMTLGQVAAEAAASMRAGTPKRLRMIEGGRS